MPQIYESIVAELEGDSEFTGILVYLGSVPQGASLPALVFSVVSSVYVGISHSGASLRRDRVQFSGVHTQLDQASLVRGKVFKVLNNFYGVMGGGLNVMSCLPSGSGRDMYDEQTQYWLAQHDWQLEYQEENE